LDTVALHPKFDSPTVVVLVGQILHETGFVFGTYQAFIDTDFLMRGVLMPEYPFYIVHKGLVPCTGFVVWFSTAWQPFVVDEMAEAQQAGKEILGKHFPQPWDDFGTEWTSMMLWLAFLMMPIFRIQVRNPFILCMVVLIQFFSGVGTLPALLLNHLLCISVGLSP
jgi:hypothetical protein